MSTESERHPDNLHVYPAEDLVEHELVGLECVCGPKTVPVKREDGSFGWQIIHHSLDRREQKET